MAGGVDRVGVRGTAGCILCAWVKLMFVECWERLVGVSCWEMVESRVGSMESTFILSFYTQWCTQLYVVILELATNVLTCKPFSPWSYASRVGHEQYKVYTFIENVHVENRIGIHFLR